MHHLVEDVQAVIRHTGRDKATIIGHDWGGAIAWIFAIGLPALTERLVILNCPHPTGITRELVLCLDKAFAQSHRLPDAVFSGHVHNYQRFTRKLNGHEIPYLVIGSGGSQTS